jgi:DNA replication protein DnaC
VADILAKADCPRCGGSGFVVAAVGGAGTARRCDCGADLLLPRLLEAAAIPVRYRACTLDNFQVSNLDPRERERLFEAREKCRRYVDNFLDATGRTQEAGLLFVGPPGAGKTHLATAVLSAIVRRFRVRGRFVDFSSLIHQIQSTFDPSSPESKHDVLDPVIDAELLVLDELGAQKPTAFVTDTLYLILNSRYTNRRPTIFTSNFRLERGRDSNLAAIDLLESRLTPALVSRLYEMAAPVALEVADFRREIGQASLPSKVWGA